MNDVNLFTGEGTSLGDTPAPASPDADNTVDINGQQMTPIGEAPISSFKSHSTENMEPVGYADPSHFDPASLVKHDPAMAVKSYRQQNPDGITFGDVMTAGPKMVAGFAKGLITSIPPLYYGGKALLSTPVEEFLPGVDTSKYPPELQQELKKKDAELTGAWLDTRESLKDQYAGLKLNKSKLLNMFSNITGGRVGEKLSDDDIKSYLLSQAHQRDIASKVQSGDIKGALSQISDEGGTWFANSKKFQEASKETPTQEDLTKVGYSGEEAANIGQAAELGMWSALPLGKLIPEAVVAPVARAGLSTASKSLTGAASIFDNPIIRRGMHYSPVYATFSALSGHPHGIAALGMYAAKPIAAGLRGAGEVLGEAAMKPEEATALSQTREIAGVPASMMRRGAVKAIQAGAEGAVSISPFALPSQSPEEVGQTLGTGAMFGIGGLATRQAMLDASLWFHGGAPLNLSTEHFEYGTPYDAVHADATKDFPDKLKASINRARHGNQGLGELYVLPENVFDSKFQPGALGVEEGNIYLRGELGARIALAHEPMHSIFQTIPEAAQQATFDSLLKFNNPSEFASRYASDLFGEPVSVDFDKLPDKVADPTDSSNPYRLTKRMILEEMAVDAMKNKGFDDITKNPDIVRWLQLGAGKMMEKLGIPISDTESKGIRGINPSYVALSIMEQALRSKAVAAAKEGPTYGKPVADPGLHFDTVKHALRSMGYNAGEAEDKANQSIDAARALGRSVEIDDLIKHSLTGKFPEAPAPKPAAPQEPELPPPIPMDMWTNDQRARANELVAQGVPEDQALKQVRDESRNLPNYMPDDFEEEPQDEHSWEPVTPANNLFYSTRRPIFREGRTTQDVHIPQGKITQSMWPEGKAPSQEILDYYNKFPARVGASGLWDSTFVSGEGQDRRVELASQLGADPKKFFHEQRPDIQAKITDYLKGSGQAQYMPRTPDSDLEKVVRDYTGKAGINYVPHQDYRSINEGYSKSIADLYDTQPHDPDNPKVQAGYDAFWNAIKDQYHTLVKHGYTIEPWPNEGQPYANSADMLKDLRGNKHLYYFETEQGGEMPEGHPMLKGSGIYLNGKEALRNDIFRWVHDALGHGVMGWQFGPRGEYNAFLTHASTLPHEAWGALANETMGQNSWVNFGHHMRNDEGNIIQPGEEGYLPITERPYASQRANLLNFMPPVDPIRAEEARGNSRPVSLDEYHALAREGLGRLSRITRGSWPTGGLDENWDKIKSDAFDLTREPWGGITIDPRTGKGVSPTPNKSGGPYAMSARGPDQPTVSIPEDSTPMEFYKAMDQAREQYKQIGMRGVHLGVFHDNATKSIDIDPVLMLDSPRDVETIGAYTRAVGGAYDFSTGNGHFPPHVADTGARPAYMPAVSDLGFYSKLEQAAEDKLPNRVSGAQALATLNSAGVKPEEIKWVMSDIDPSKTYTKQEMLDHIRDNNVQVKEVVKGGAVSYNSVANRLYGTDYDSLNPQDRTAVAISFNSEAGTKYEQHVLPGGEPGSYREVLFTLPKNKLSFEDWIKQQPDSSTAKQAPALAYGIWKQYTQTPQGFTGGHFNEPNVIAHARFDDRTDPEGKKVLMLQELQSDWAQKARAEGIKPENLDQEIKDLEKQYRNITRYGIERTPTDAWNRLSSEQLSKAADIRDQWSELKDKKDSGVPNAPFIGKTEAWTSLAFKRMLRWAAERGYDKLAWTTGEQQADRYDLSKHLQDIQYEKRGDVYNIAAFGKNGERVWDNQSATADIIESHLGKEIAQKIISGEGRIEDFSGRQITHLSGLDLKVGGEGMKGYYDKIVPSVANTIGKKFGAKVSTTKIPISDTQYDYNKDSPLSLKMDGKPGTFKVVDHAGVTGEVGRVLQSGIVGIYPARDALNAELQKIGYKRPTPTESVHSIDITPQMRESVMKGQPLFMPSVHPDAIESAAIKRKSDNRIFTPASSHQPHYMIPQSNPGTEDYLGINGHNLYDEGFVNKKGEFQDRTQALDTMKSLGQLPENYQPEYKDEANVTALNRYMPAARDMWDATPPKNRQDLEQTRGLTPGSASKRFHELAPEDQQKVAQWFPQAQYMPSWVPKGMRKNITPEEEHILENTQKAEERFFNIAKNAPPITQGMRYAQLADKQKLWYDNAANAIVDIFGNDSDRFAALLAATSPNTAVEPNMEVALHTWDKWNDAGRPTDKTDVLNVLEDGIANAMTHLRNQGKSNLARHSGESTYLNNVYRALSSDDPSPTKLRLSGPKAGSFHSNLTNSMEMLREVTNDRHIAKYITGRSDVDSKLYGVRRRTVGGENKATKTPEYIATSAHIREVANRLTKLTGQEWTPRQAQAAIWSYILLKEGRGTGAKSVNVNESPGFDTRLREYQDALQNPF